MHDLKKRGNFKRRVTRGERPAAPDALRLRPVVVGVVVIIVVRGDRCSHTDICCEDAC